MIEKAVIAAAGLGTRLLPATKEQPKEMLPVYSRGVNGELCLKPVLQLIYEKLYDGGIREFCMIIGRGKRAIEDHFTQDYAYKTYLGTKRIAAADDLEAFYRRLDESVITWVNQPEPKGFGDAVLKTERAVGQEKFLVHAGDAYILSENAAHYSRLTTVSQVTKSDATLLIHEVADPRKKGVVEVKKQGNDVYVVTSAVEKPEVPKTSLAIEPIYVFQPSIFDALKHTGLGIGGELQLTDGIATLIRDERPVHATALMPNEIRIDIGDAESYWEGLTLSYRLAKGA